MFQVSSLRLIAMTGSLRICQLWRLRRLSTVASSSCAYRKRRAGALLCHKVNPYYMLRGMLLHASCLGRREKVP